jgi:multiple sugar transport system ATP-binding protein
MAEVVFQDVTKVYPLGATAIRALNLNVARGELFVLVGPSGCGKTTTLRLVAGLEEATSGSIAIGGRPTQGVSPKDRNVAMVFQNAALYPQMNVYRNMAFGLTMRKMPPAEIDARVRQAAEMLQLTELLDRRPGTLSGGQQRRVALGRAMVRPADVFLLDEPLANLDAHLRLDLQVEIGRLHRRLGATMIYVTHDQAEAMTLGDRIGLLRDGALEQVADPLTLYRRPANRFVAQFIGSPPMNFIQGHVRAEQGRPVFVANHRGLVFPVPLSACQALDPYRDRAVALGVRPEHLGSAAAEELPHAPRIEGTVESVQRLGADSYVHLNAPDSPLIGRVDSRRSLSVGEPASLALLSDAVLFFDQGTEKLIG